MIVVHCSNKIDVFVSNFFNKSIMSGQYFWKTPYPLNANLLCCINKTKYYFNPITKGLKLLPPNTAIHVPWIINVQKRTETELFNASIFMDEYFADVFDTIPKDITFMYFTNTELTEYFELDISRFLNLNEFEYNIPCNQHISLILPELLKSLCISGGVINSLHLNKNLIKLVCSYVTFSDFIIPNTLKVLLICATHGITRLDVTDQTQLCHLGIYRVNGFVELVAKSNVTECLDFYNLDYNTVYDINQTFNGTTLFVQNFYTWKKDSKFVWTICDST